MFKRVVSRSCLAALCLVIMAGFAPALDTSPYLLGSYNELTEVTIINPTTKWLTVYAIAYSGGGPVACWQDDIPPNGVVIGGGKATGGFGTLKIFAFPQGTRKFDPNAVIGGYQAKWLSADARSEAGLKGVTINSYTIQEFSGIPSYNHPCWQAGQDS
jgi:hypothetical protein